MFFRGSKGVTLVELLVALAIASLLMGALIAAFQTTQRSAAIGEAREHVYQNARVALDIVSREIKNAHIDNRNRDLVFVSADGLAGRGNSILEYDPSTYAVDADSGYGLGNAQTPHGIDPTGTDVFELYADETFRSPIYSLLSIKAIDDIYTLSPGPPDRLDFTTFTSNFPGNTTNVSRLCEVRYIVTTETFVDDRDNDYDGDIDENDSLAGFPGVGDLIAMERADDFHPVTRKIKGLNLFQLRRGIDISPDRNPFSALDLATGDGDPADPQGRYPSRDFSDWTSANGGENIGSYIYDLQFEFYGKIAIALDSNGAPEVWGVGWGYQDVRGEDVGIDDLGPEAVSDGNATIDKSVDPRLVTLSVNPTDISLLEGGIFFAWLSGTTEYDIDDPDSDVYLIESVTSPNQLTLNRDFLGPYTGDQYVGDYRIIEPTQANGILDNTGTVANPVYPEDTGSDGIMNDPGVTDGDPLDDGSGFPNNVSDNDGTTAEPSVGEGNNRLDSRVMGIWDSRSPDPRNPRGAAELNGQDDGSGGHTASFDDDSDGTDDDTASDAAGAPEGLTTYSEANNLIDDDSDGIVDDRFYEPAGRPEGVDEPGEADPDDDSLPKAVRITIAARDPQQSLRPVVISTVVWLSTAK